MARWGLLIALTLSSAGCGLTAHTDSGPGQSTTPAAPTTASASTAFATSAATTSRTAASTATSVSSGDAERIDPVFADLARRLAPMPVYGWTTLPDRVTVASEWWPVVDRQAPEQYEGPSRDNPWVSSAPPAEPQAQLVLACDAGWLAVLENFRGDPGDVAGEQVGPVNGHDAALYAVNNGLLVQWSDGGRWYGLFGRGVPADDLVAMALDMIPMER